MCHREPQTQLACYVRVLRDSCNTSVVDINMLKTIFYNARLWEIGTASWPGSKTEFIIFLYT